MVYQVSIIKKELYSFHVEAFDKKEAEELALKNWKEKGIKDKVKVIEFLSNYQYSSYLDFLGKNRSQLKIINLKDFPNYFPDKKAFLKEIFDWLNFVRQDLTH